MSEELPKGWQSAELDAFGKWRGGGTPSKAVPEYWSKGTVHWVSPKDMKRLLIDSAQDQITPKAVTESAANLIPKDSVLMVTRSGILEHTFPVSINTVEVAVNQDLKAWTPHHGIDPTYVAYFLKARGKDILNVCSKDGTTVSSIDFDRLKSYSIFLAPTSEQERIVSKIDELFSSIDEGERALERVRKLVERYRQSVLKAAVTGELTREWREQHAGELESGEALLTRMLEARRQAWEHVQSSGNKPASKSTRASRTQTYRTPPRPNLSGLPIIPASWTWVSVGELLDSALVGLDRGANQQCTVAEGVPYVRMNNISKNGTVALSQLDYVHANPNEKRRFALKSGDILFNTRNSRELVGKVGLVVNPARDTVYNNNVMRIRLLDELSAGYVLTAMLESSFKRRLEEVKKATTSVAAIYAKDLLPLPLPMPSVREQEVIACEIEEIDRNLAVLTIELLKQADRLKSLRQSVLKAAFSGQLVPQDPTDEPASVLLERIAAERAAAPKRTVAKQTRATQPKKVKHE